MRFVPLLPWWLLVPVFVLLLAAVLLAGLRSPGTTRFALGRRIAMVVLLLLIAVRPVLPGGGSTALARSLDVIFVVDTTSSVSAEDYQGSKPRLEGIKADLTAVAEELAGARFGLITFAATAQVEMPLVTDVAAVSSAVDVLSAELAANSDGSSIDRPVEAIGTLLDGAKKTRPDHDRVVVFVSDGEQTVDTPPKSFAALKSKVDGAVVLGYGTTQGGRMEFFTGTPYGKDAPTGRKKTYIQDKSGKEARSTIDEKNLRKVASELGGSYVHRTAPGNLDEVVAETDLGDLGSPSGATGGTETYWVFASLLAAVMLAELWTTAQLVGATRRRTA